MEFYMVKIAGDWAPFNEESAGIVAGLAADTVIKCSLVSEKQRTLTQNAAMHKYFELLAKALNDAGYDMKRTLKEETEIPWTKESVKEHLWRPIQKIMEGTGSTTELNTSEPSVIYAVLSRHMSEKFGINVEFPSNS